jgi:hypothetical protein
MPYSMLFDWRTQPDKASKASLAVARGTQNSRTVLVTPGRPLRVTSLELADTGVCPDCTQLGAGGYVSLVEDLRLAFACPSCQKLVWIPGA